MPDDVWFDEEYGAVLIEPPNILVIFTERNLVPNRLIASRVLAADPLSALLVATIVEGGDRRGPRFLRLMGFEYDKGWWKNVVYDSPPNLI